MQPLQVAELPNSKLVGKTATVPGFEKLLVIAANGHHPLLFHYFDRALGASRSCRLLFQDEVPGFTRTCPFPRPFDVTMTAREFFRADFMRQVRYDPIHAPSPRSKKGWEVRVANVDDKPVIIVWSAWVP